VKRDKKTEKSAELFSHWSLPEETQKKLASSEASNDYDPTIDYDDKVMDDEVKDIIFSKAHLKAESSKTKQLERTS